MHILGVRRLFTTVIVMHSDKRDVKIGVILYYT